MFNKHVMPNDAQISLQACLSSLEQLQNGPEDAVFSTINKDHPNLLQSLKTLLCNKVEVSPTDANRVLRICLQYITDVRCVLDVFSIISELIDIDKDNPHVDFLPFGLAVLKFLNTKCLEANTSKLRILSLQMLMKHPKSTLVILIKHHWPKIVQTFQPIVGLKQVEDLPLKIESFKLLTMLEWLPPYEKKLFVEAGVSLWLAGIIPAMVQIMVSTEDVDKIEVCLTYTEMLANELVHLNYFENPHWKPLLERIANPKMFPASIMGLLQKEKDNWHRIWIVLIKLLKNQVTQAIRPFTSPINSMLPVVESAFKKESAQRVRAFACWYELVEGFYTETGNCLKKRIKLLMIPLKLLNTKTEETAVAKFHTWWHFIHKFRPKIKNEVSEIVVSFLHFMFGRHTVMQIHATQFSDYLRMRCIEAFEEIMNLKQLDDNIISVKILLDHWKDFTYALKSCISAVAQTYTNNTKKHIQSIWISFVMRLAAMPENTVRMDMFDDLITIVSELILENKNLGNECLMEILVDDITLPLWRDNKLKPLTQSRSQSYRPMHRIVKLIMDDQFNNYFKRFNAEELTKLLQPLVNTVLEESISKPQYIIWLLDELLVTESTLVMWTAWAQASKESKLSMEAFHKILIWPFKTVNITFEVKEAAKAWYTLYNFIHENLEETDFYNEISKVLTRPVEDSKASNYFVLFALIGVLNHKLDEPKMEKLEALTYEMNDYNDYEQLLAPLVNLIVLMINNSTDENLAQITINCVENILNGLKSETEAITSKITVQNRTVLSDTITSTLKTYLDKCPYQPIKNQVKSILYLYDIKTESCKKVSESTKKLNERSPEITPFTGWDTPVKEFASPKIQKLKQSIKETSIVSKVVENGEEYVVIKSNWKFNPKNLTENQKEKLQRKKADIPALYGDLSQSQEFKLTSWKTDSQDTSLSSSKSATSNDVADNLKKITNSNIIPKIIENILDTDKNSKVISGANVSPIAKVKTPKAKLSTPGETKSPRMALKDRVCRNVRNLIGNSSPSPQEKVTDKQEDTSIVQNVPKSPLSQPEALCLESPDKNAISKEKIMKPSNDDVITSEKQQNRGPVTSPPMKKNIVSTQRIDQIIRLACTPVSNRQKEIINLHTPTSQTTVERPPRMKKTPKKFHDTLVLPIKRRRYSKNYSQSNFQDLLESRTESVIAEIHNPDDKMDVSDVNSSQIVPSDEADTNENAKKTTTNDNIIVEIEKTSAASDDKGRKDEKATLISPKKSINKPTAKSPVKSSIGEVSSSLSNASEGVHKDAVQNETYDVIDKPNGKSTEHMETPNTSTKKCRKSRVKKKISANDRNATVNTTATPDKDIYQPKLSAKTSVLLNDTDKNAEKVEVVSTSINKIKMDSDTTQLPISKSQELKKTSKRVGAQHNVIPDHMDTPNIISQRKFRKSKVQKEISANYENATVNTTATPDKDIYQPKLSAKISVLLNDTDKNAEKVEVVSTSINEIKINLDTTQLPISISKELQKTSKNVSAQHDVIPDHMNTPNIYQKEISGKDENAAVNSPVTADKDLYQPKLLTTSSVLLNDTDKNTEMVEVVSTSVNKTKIDSDTTQLPFSKSQELQKTSKSVGAQQDVLPDHMDTPKIYQKKIRTSKVQKEISANNEYAAVNTQESKVSPKNNVLLYDTDKNIEKVLVIPIPTNKTQKDSDASLHPLSKPQEPQNTPKKLDARRDVIMDQMDIPNLSPRKFRKSKVPKEIGAKDENAAVSTPDTTGKGLKQPKLSAKKRVLQNDSDMNVEKVEVVPISTSKAKNDSDINLLKSAKKSLSVKYSNENKVLSYTVKTNEASHDKMIQKKSHDVKAENNMDEENQNLLFSPKTQKKKKSRIENELAIDMVEGHPFLKTQSAKRLTRKKLMEVNKGSKRKTLVDKLNKSKLELTTKTSKKDKKRSPLVNRTIIVEDSQDKAQSNSPQKLIDVPHCSEDVIESSQDSTMTTISTKAKMRTPKRIPVVSLEIITLPTTLTQNLLQDSEVHVITDKENHENTDLVLPQNKSVGSDKNVIDLTENMYTEPIGDSKNTTDLIENMDTETLEDDLIILSETLPTPVTVNSESDPVIGPETQELAEADTQPNDPNQFEKWNINKPILTSPNSNPPEYVTIEDNDITQSLPEAALILSDMGDTTEVSSPFKDDNQKKQDFLNNTVEISPIKVQSPDRQKKSPSPETNRDFVVIQLSSPVHSNGEPFEKPCSPEFFTEDKLSPDKQNASPPRVEETVTYSSPSATLSLKKNRPQVNRPCIGRAAQMLDLLSVSSESNNETLDSNTPVRAVLNFKHTGNYCLVEQNGTEEIFLQLQRSLPTVTSSLSGPILKRKFEEKADDTVSPAKRKRVSFHDPPVSTTVSVQKYIDRRQTRSGTKSPRKLDNAFLDSALSKTVESFTEATTPSDETENISLDITPVVEIVKTSELNDTDPICPDLIECTDPIDVIAIELSSAAMRDSFVKELEGKVHTVGDLAKMTELEVNRLCIKAPKITVAKKVLTDYITNRPAIAVDTVIEEAFSEPMTESLLHESKADVEMQTDEVEVSTKATQVAVEEVSSAETQTEVVVTANTAVQTVESGYKTSEEIILMSERAFFEKFKALNDDQLGSIAGLLSEASSSTLIHRILMERSKGIPKSNEPGVQLTFLRNLLLEKYGTADLGALCIDIMKAIFKPA